MLEAIGLTDLDDLFEAVPAGVRLGRALEVPEALSEPELMRHLRALAGRSRGAADLVCFAGGRAYDHHVPAAVKALASRAEFATSYTPYQPELSQGVLQALYEFQTLVCEIYGLEVANASLYDGANALVEAVNLSARVTKRDRILVGATVNPQYLDVLETYTSGLGFTIERIPYAADGAVDWSSVDATGVASLVCGYPNFFGRLEDVPAAAAAAHAAGALLVAVTDPTAMGVLRSPGEMGADVAVGEGHALGNPLSYGGPYVGLFATRDKFVRQMPGRLAGETVDSEGRRGFVLTLSTREQHIRREKATSNICTNSGLCALAFTIHMTLLGEAGLKRLAHINHANAVALADKLDAVDGVEVITPAFFNEFTLRVRGDAAKIIDKLADKGVLGGVPVSRLIPGKAQLSDLIIVASTEINTDEDHGKYAQALKEVL